MSLPWWEATSRRLYFFVEKMVRILDNSTVKLGEDLREAIQAGDRISVAASCFSMYAFRELKKQLEGVSEFRFLFTSPAFLKEKNEKERREFFIPRTNRERGLYGTEFEVRLRNELTQRAIARECADWIRKKAHFKSNVTGDGMGEFLLLDGGEGRQRVYQGISGFTTVDLGCERGNNLFRPITCIDEPETTRWVLQRFDELWRDCDKMRDVTEELMESIGAAYAENPPELIYFLTLYHVFSEFLTDLSEDTLPNEATGFKQSRIWQMLYDFQRDAALGVIHKLEKHNGCILADSVGLGKTFTALAVIKYYESRNKSVLVLCPKKLSENWNTYNKSSYKNNPIAADRLNYDVLFHTDLSRHEGSSNGMNLGLINWGNYDLVVIDESHNFRNGAGTHRNTQASRYERLMQDVMRAGVKTKVLMLSATPVNNRFTDLKNQLLLACEGDAARLEETLDTEDGIGKIFRQAQRAFDHWSELPQEARTTDALLRSLNFDFFEVLDSVTIARSRKHIEKYYDTAKIGSFPTRLPPISLSPGLSDLPDVIQYQEIFEQLCQLSLCVYAPSSYLLESRREQYSFPGFGKGGRVSQSGREEGLRRLMGINLLKRLESSVDSFRLTLQRIQERMDRFLGAIRQLEETNHSDFVITECVGEDDWEEGDEEIEAESESGASRKVDIRLTDLDYVSWGRDLRRDAEALALLSEMVSDITPEHDAKLQKLLRLIDDKFAHPINPGNRKLLIFSASSDTAEYLYEHVSAHVEESFGYHVALVTGSGSGGCRTTIPRFHADFNQILTCFSPVSRDREALGEPLPDIEVLIATDCISEGQNLQDCDFLVNYDIHWNPVRIIQRFGRIDRIGSRNRVIQLVNFWPDLSLDEYIKLKGRVESRMKASSATSAGEDVLDPEERVDLEYRRAQLERLKKEVVDLEEMTEGVSIMDLGLNEFRQDLLEYQKAHKEELLRKPMGLHAVAGATAELPPGVLFVLKNLNDSVNSDRRNRIHPFYMVYVGADGTPVCDYLNPKQLLNDLRLLCKGKDKPIPELYRPFNQETRDGRDMRETSQRLDDAIRSILDSKDQSDLESLFHPGGTSALENRIAGLSDFELVCFLVVR